MWYQNNSESIKNRLQKSPSSPGDSSRPPPRRRRGSTRSFSSSWGLQAPCAWRIFCTMCGGCERCKGLDGNAKSDGKWWKSMAKWWKMMQNDCWNMEMYGKIGAQPQGKVRTWWKMIENYKVSVTKMPYGRQIRKYCALFGVALLRCNLLIPLPKAISESTHVQFQELYPQLYTNFLRAVRILPSR